MDFWPISLYNVVYRILSKLLASCIKPLLNNLIGIEQSGFLMRSVYDNILIAQEVAHSMFDSKGKNLFVMFKIELQKACDHLSWDTILRTLYSFEIADAICVLD